MRDRLHRKYLVQKEVSQNDYFEGEIEFSEMQRLTDLLYQEDPQQYGLVNSKFEFKRSEYDVPMLTGNVSASLVIVCQRCLGRLDIVIDSEFQFLIDADDDLIDTSNLDSLISDNGCIDIIEVVEDELILGIPLVGKHDDDSCNEHWQTSVLQTDVAVKENPFSVLKTLKTT